MPLIASSHNLASLALNLHSCLLSFPFHKGISQFTQTLTKFKQKTRHLQHMLTQCGATLDSLNMSGFYHRFQLFCHIATIYISLQSQDLMTLELAFDDQGQFANGSGSLFRS